MKTDKIANKIKEYLNGFDEKKMHSQMIKHYTLLHLIDKEEKWATPRLQKISQELLPSDLTEIKSKAFVDEMAKLAESNPYLMNFLKKAQNEKFEHLSEKVRMEGKIVFPDIIAYANVLERLTKAMYENPNIIEECSEVFRKAREGSNSFKYKSLFHRVKFMSVQYPIRKIIIKCHKTGIVPAGMLGNVVALNILEAIIDDYISGYKNNARAGWSLAINRGGSKRYNPKTGAGPSCWSVDKKGICVSMPMPKKWADLYQTWNMAFVSNIPDYPYVIPKLFIPQVAAYQEKPTEYMYNRALALYLHLNHAAFNYANKLKMNESVIQWRDHKLTSLWGKSNAESAQKFKAELAKRK